MFVVFIHLQNVPSAVTQDNIEVLISAQTKFDGSFYILSQTLFAFNN
jgi:hypothetical protein